MGAGEGRAPDWVRVVHPALYPHGYTQNWSAAKLRAATAQMLRPLWTQEDGFWRRAQPDTVQNTHWLGVGAWFTN